MNIALNKAVNASSFVAPYSPNRAVDGSVEPTHRWVCTSLPGWMYVDFGQPFWINRWVARLMGAAGWTSSYNMSDFRLQGSNDLGTWTDLDIVTGNSLNIVDHTFTAGKYRYARVFANTGIPINRNLISIMEMEVYEAPATSANLLNLSVVNGRQILTIVPNFNKDTLSYTLSVENSITSIAVIPTAEDTNAVIKVNGIIVNSGARSGNITLNVGSNIITVQVTPQIGDIKTYNVTVTRTS